MKILFTQTIKEEVVFDQEELDELQLTPDDLKGLLQTKGVAKFNVILTCDFDFPWEKLLETEVFHEPDDIERDATVAMYDDDNKILWDNEYRPEDQKD